jgi:hypothetical protein
MIPNPYIIDITALITRIEVSFQCIPTTAQRTAATNPQKTFIGNPMLKLVNKTHINASRVPAHL